MTSCRHNQLLRVASIALLMSCVVMLAACGSDATSTTPNDAPQRVAPTTTSTQPHLTDESREPTAAAVASGRRLDALVAAYAPVSARLNFFVAAETLRADAVEKHMSADVEQERAGSVRIEARSMQRLLGEVRPRIVASTVRSRAERQIRSKMLTAIDARVRALREAVQALDAINAGAGDSDVAVLVDRWHGSWNAALRAAREATNVLQDERERLLLDPASEQAIR